MTFVKVYSWTENTNTPNRMLLFFNRNFLNLSVRHEHQSRDNEHRRQRLYQNKF